MWPTPVARPGTPSGWSKLDGRARVLVLLGTAALVLATSAATVLSIRLGQSAAPIYGDSPSGPATVWTWDGRAYERSPIAGGGPTSNEADMAFDRSRGTLVLWDHGCDRLIMGFTGGCASVVNRTWTSDGARWTARQVRTTPTEVGQGAMLYESRLGMVIYVNGVGQAWAWTGSDWSPLSMRGAPHVPQPGSAAESSTFAVGYDEGRDLLVYALSAGTRAWGRPTRR